MTTVAAAGDELDRGRPAEAGAAAGDEGRTFVQYAFRKDGGSHLADIRPRRWYACRKNGNQ